MIKYTSLFNIVAPKTYNVKENKCISYKPCIFVFSYFHNWTLTWNFLSPFLDILIPQNVFFIVHIHLAFLSRFPLRDFQLKLSMHLCYTNSLLITVSHIFLELTFRLILVKEQKIWNFSLCCYFQPFTAHLFCEKILSSEYNGYYDGLKK
jgi:hypothetical protein